MAGVGTSEGLGLTCIACRLRFHTDDAQRAHYGTEEGVVRLLLKHGASVAQDTTVAPRTTCLHMAVMYNNVAIVKMVLNAGADVNAVNEAGESVLALAERRGRQKGPSREEVLHIIRQWT